MTLIIWAFSLIAIPCGLISIAANPRVLDRSGRIRWLVLVLVFAAWLILVGISKH